MSGIRVNPTSTKSHDKHVYKVLVADDHDIFRHGLKVLLNKYDFIRFKGEASNGKELRKLVEKERPDLIFMDLHMPGGHGVEAVTAILREYPETKIIVLSFYNDALTVERMMKLGASAYLTKNISLQILDTMFERVLNGKPYICPLASENVALNKISPGPSPGMPEQSQWLADEITNREKQVLKMITSGMSQKQMADILSISVRTVETHKEKLMKKLGAKNKAELISMAHEFKLI